MQQNQSGASTSTIQATQLRNRYLAARNALIQYQRKLQELSVSNRLLRGKMQQLENRQHELENFINHNPDTGLPVRRVFEHDFETMLKRAAASHKPVAVGFLRLDDMYQRIKNSRDRSKALLYRTVERIQNILGKYLYQSDRADEFIFFIEKVQGPAQLRAAMESITATVRHYHEGPAKDVSFGCNIGMAVIPNHGRDRETILSNAGIALEYSVEHGPTEVLYTEEMGQNYKQKIKIYHHLSHAMRDEMKDFSLVYQPFADGERRVCGAEVLVRWSNVELGQVSPATFIPIAEESGDIIPLGQWILYNSCKQVAPLLRNSTRPVFLSVNLSPHQFKMPDLAQRLAAVIQAHQIPRGQLKLEITEGAIMEDPKRSIRIMHQIKELGAQIAIDDFGVGYSSLSFLKRFPVDVLKIDQSFVADLAENRQNQGIVAAILAMARSLNLRSLAEGVDSEAKFDFLRKGGCDYFQGYYFSKPVALEQFLTHARIGRFRNEPAA